MSLRCCYVSRGNLKQLVLECVTYEWSHPQLLLLWGLSDPRIAEPLFNNKTEQVKENIHRALSPHPHVIICTSIISPKDCTVFLVLQYHLNDHYSVEK